MKRKYVLHVNVGFHNDTAGRYVIDICALKSAITEGRSEEGRILVARLCCDLILQAKFYYGYTASKKK